MSELNQGHLPFEVVDYSKELFVDGHIYTHTGKYFNPLDPQLDLICIEDIAHALSNLPRFAGHLPRFYSVAQHSLYCQRLAPDDLKLVMLLHDAAEAYGLLDIPSPVKKHFPEYQRAEGRLMHAITCRFGVNNEWLTRYDEIKTIDVMALKAEWDVHMKGRSTAPYPLLSNAGTNPLNVEGWFLRKFHELYKP